MGWSRTSITVNPSSGPITTLPLGEGFVYSSPLTLIAMLSGTLISIHKFFALDPRRCYLTGVVRIRRLEYSVGENSLRSLHIL